MVGRRSKLNKKLINDAVKLIKAGNYVSTVTKYLGVSERSWYNWINEGEKGNEEGKNNLKVQFFQSIKNAEAEAEIRLITDLQKIAAEDKKWQGIAWMLERKYPERWGRKDYRQVDANINIKDYLEALENVSDDVWDDDDYEET